MSDNDKKFKLDNPVWHSLTEDHQEFSICYPGIKFYHPDYCPFGGIEKLEDTSKHVDDYAKLIDNFFIVGEKPELSKRLELKRELVCLQMTIDDPINIEAEEEIIALTTDYAETLFQLVNLVQPGYFRTRTKLLGDYFGIFRNGELVAAAGERMKMNDFTEVSAIVTHPDYTGRGYAKQLTAHTVNRIFSKGDTPFLHVLETNASAIKLYEKLGFTRRRKISFWNVVFNKT